MVLIHFQERFQIDAFSMKPLSVLVWMERPKRIQMSCVSKLKRSSVGGAKVYAHQEEEEEMVFKIKEENL